MAPLALENITEEIATTKKRGFDLHECMSKVYAAAAGSFCVGFSGGVATQVHFARYIPRPFRALLVIPAAFGSIAAGSVYHHQSKLCLQEWAASIDTEVPVTVQQM